MAGGGGGGFLRKGNVRKLEVTAIVRRCERLRPREKDFKEEEEEEVGRKKELLRRTFTSSCFFSSSSPSPQLDKH